MRLLLSLAMLSLLSGPVFAGELVSLPIKNIQQMPQDRSVQVLVDIEFQSCKYNYKGLYFEPVATGQGQTRFHVHALAAEVTSGTCDDPKEHRTYSQTFTPTNGERFDFIAVQPK